MNEVDMTNERRMPKEVYLNPGNILGKDLISSV